MKDDKQILKAAIEAYDSYCGLGKAMEPFREERPFIEGYKAAIAAMQQQIDTERMELANQEIATLTAKENLQRVAEVLYNLRHGCVARHPSLIAEADRVLAILQEELK